MILGYVRRAPGSVPPWFALLGLKLAREEAEGTVHFGISGACSRFQSDQLVVAVESGTANRLDARAVATAYLRSGTVCVRDLPGRFRFLLHDVKAGHVVAASSTAPPWPLAYWSDSRTTVVSSEILSMLRCPDVPRALDEGYLAHLVLGLSAMRDGTTALRDIRRLCPGEALIVDSSGARVTRVDRLTPRPVLGRREQLGELFLEELAGGVGRCVEGGESVVSLSGGIDSAAIAGVALGRTDGLPALSFVAPSLDASAEIASIQAMEQAWPRLHATQIDASDAQELPDLGQDLTDDPFLTPIALLPARMLLWARARDGGFRRLLEGEGGDELFSMLPTPLDALRGGRVLTAARNVLASSGRRALVERSLWLPMLPRRVQRAWLERSEPIQAHLPSFAKWDATEHPIVREATSEYLATLVHRPFEERINEWLAAPSFVGASLSRRHLAAGFGLDLEWPMLERGVLELVLGLHAADAIRGGPQKPFLQQALIGVVPDAVRLAPKSIGLYRALIPKVLTSPRSREALRDTRVRRRLADLVRFERVEAMVDGLAAGRSLTINALWALECLVSFAVWYARASEDCGVC